MKTVFILAIFFGLFTSCSTTQQVQDLKPQPSNNTPVVYKNNTSFISMPVKLSLKEIEFQLNKNLNGLIYNDSILDDDKTQMKVWKTADIKLTENKGEIISTIPLKIWTKIKYGTDFLGLNDTKEIFLNGTITLNSKAHLTNWKLTTSSNIKDVTWKESPVVIIAGKQVPITYLINPTLSIFKKKIATKIDEAINKTCDFKPQVLSVLQNLSAPYLTSETYEAWFKLIPLELYVTEAILSKSNITMNMGLKCQMQTMVGDKPKNTFNASNIILKPVKDIPENTTVSIAAVSTFKNASKIITNNFKDKEFSSRNKKITIENVEVWNKDNKMIIALTTKGSLDGTIYLSGIPNYNAITKEIFFEDVDYVLSTKGLLTKTANWLLNGIILKKIQENCRYSIKENLEEGKKSMQPFLQNYCPMKGVFINGNITDLTFEKIELNNNAIIAFINGSGKMNITIDGME